MSSLAKKVCITFVIAGRVTQGDLDPTFMATLAGFHIDDHFF